MTISPSPQYRTSGLDAVKGSPLLLQKHQKMKELLHTLNNLHMRIILLYLSHESPKVYLKYIYVNLTVDRYWTVREEKATEFGLKDVAFENLATFAHSFMLKAYFKYEL
ncbi:hypothetical protein ABH892_002973 [Paenibacillus sp. RC254]